MNKHAKNEIMLLLGIGALTALALRRYKWAEGLAWSAAALHVSKDKKPKSFRGQSVVITGGSRGLGLALAKRLVSEGAIVHLFARDEAELMKAQEILTARGRSELVNLIVCDVTNPEQLSGAIRQVCKHSGRIDMLINNAGAILVGPFDSMTQADFEAQMNLHLYANISATKEVLPIFRRQRSGQIVNICSMGGKVAVPHMLPYDTSKFALAGFSQGLTAELAKENIAVTTVYPATMRTGSPIQAVFKGNAEKEFSWFANADVMPGLSIAADDAAEKILQAARDRRTELIPSSLGRLRIIAGALFPEIMMTGMGLINRLLPSGNSFMYRTGAQSETNHSYLLKSFQATAKQAEKDFNQSKKTDPQFNLGLHK
ncbi:MAG: SDR family oxidoreductase [Bdellovibrionaceae bacterium]|nr:SDR family oxidoreductase [Bdellovibrio sp.]